MPMLNHVLITRQILNVLIQVFQEFLNANGIMEHVVSITAQMQKKLELPMMHVWNGFQIVLRPAKVVFIEMITELVTHILEMMLIVLG